MADGVEPIEGNQTNNLNNPSLRAGEIISVFNQEAFTARHIPDLGYDVKESRTFHWRLHDWKQLEKELTSPEFYCGGHKWRILLFPFGNPRVLQSLDTVSLYLDSANPKEVKEGHVCAQFALAISNPHDPTLYTVSHAHHRFISQEPNWGFTKFSELHKLYHPQPGHDRQIIEDGSAVVSVYVRVLEDPTAALWDASGSYGSKKETGHVGLKFRDATSYMNSLLQSLFFTHSFRKAVYQIPTEGENPTESIPMALQQVFYRLETSDEPVYTTELTKSFGWTPYDSFLPHDVHEFNRLLQDKLEPRLKGTHAEGAIAHLFAGKMKSLVKCVNVNYESCSIEEFHDIQLNVKGITTLYDAFRDYVAVEVLHTENRYQTGLFGLQVARKSIVFQSLPPVLHLQLKRYEYDLQLGSPKKIDDRFEFPFEIDLEEFLEKTADRSESWNYKLHSVLVHSGPVVSGGKYFAIIKSDRDSRWLKFDDDRVGPVTDREVLEENYGGEPFRGVLSETRQNQAKVDRFKTAYMLVYIRESVIDKVLAPLTEEDVPVYLKRRFDERPLSLPVKIVTDETFFRHEGFDLANFNEGNLPLSDLPTFRALKKETYSAFKSRIAQHFGYPESRIKLWVLLYRQNKTVRAHEPIPDDQSTLTVEMIRNKFLPKHREYLWLYLDILPDPPKNIPLDNAGTTMIFLKHFHATRQSLCGICKIHMPSASKVNDLIPIINERMKWASGTPLKLYEEIKPGMVELMKQKYTFTKSEIQDGDIICFQVDISNEETHNLESQGLCSNPPQFYDSLQNRVMVLFKPKFDEPTIEQPEFSLLLSKKQDYDAMASKVGEHLKHEPIKLRFTTTHTVDGRPKSVLKCSQNQSVAEIITLPSFVVPAPILILYEKLHVSIAKLETKRCIQVVWTGVHNKEELTYLFLSPSTSMVHDLTERLSKRVQLTPTGTGRIRVFKMAQDRRTRREFVGSEMIGNLPHPVKLLAEEIPREDLEAKGDGKVINIFHFDRYVEMTHGVPFEFVVKRGERLSETKKRLQRRIGVSNDDFSRFKFALVRISVFEMPSYFEDDDVIYEHEFTPENLLGLDHVDSSRRAEVTGFRFGTIKDTPNPVQLFAEEIRQEESESEDNEAIDDFYFTRDVARTLRIPFKFGFATGLKSSQEVYNTDSEIERQQQEYRRIFSPTAILSQVLRDPEPEIERYIDEIDNRLENHILSDGERRRLFNELCKKCSRHRVIPKSMHIPDCWEDSVEVEYGCSANVLQSIYKGHRVAVKSFRVYLTSDPATILSRFCREGVAWKHLRHPNILPLLGVTVNEHRIAMVSGWMENGNINQFVQKDPHSNRPMLLADAANGVKYLHDLRIVHGDLKGANILINQDRRACIADFGLVTVGGVVTRGAAQSSKVSLISNDSLMSFTAGGTYRWMSPELLYPEGFGIPQQESDRPTRQSDCYAFGMVIYEVLCGHHPYVEIQSDVFVVNAIMEGVRPEKPEGAARLGFTDGLWRVLEQCWLEDRGARPSVEDILPPLNDATIHWLNRKFHSSW